MSDLVLSDEVKKAIDVFCRENHVAMKDLDAKMRWYISERVADKITHSTEYPKDSAAFYGNLYYKTFLEATELVRKLCYVPVVNRKTRRKGMKKHATV